MAKFIIRRLLWIIPVMLGVIFIVFTINRFSPGDPVAAELGGSYTQEQYDAKEAELGKYVLAENNYLWHLFSYDLVPHLKGDEARKALPEGPCWQFYCEYPPEGAPLIREVTAEDIAALPESLDWYLVDKQFTWTYVHTHEADCGPYFCKPE